MEEKMDIAKKLLKEPLEIPPRMVTTMVFEAIEEGGEIARFRVKGRKPWYILFKDENCEECDAIHKGDYQEYLDKYGMQQFVGIMDCSNE